MGIHNIIIQELRTQIWLEHKTFHTGPVNWPNELCIYCDEEVKAIQADHIQGEVDEQVRADAIQDQEMRWGEEQEEVEE